MTGDILNGLIQTYGFPAAFIIWVWWEGRKNQVKRDPTAELIDTLKSIDKRQDEINDRMIRLETKVEMMGK